jgi:hypothetical protein
MLQLFYVAPSFPKSVWLILFRTLITTRCGSNRGEGSYLVLWFMVFCRMVGWYQAFWWTYTANSGMMFLRNVGEHLPDCTMSARMTTILICTKVVGWRIKRNWDICVPFTGIRMGASSVKATRLVYMLSTMHHLSAVCPSRRSPAWPAGTFVLYI